MVVLDTHVVLWLASSPERISKSALAAMTDACRDGGLAVSDVSLAEIALLAAKGRVLKGSVSAAFLHSMEQSYRVFEISARIALQAAEFSRHFPRDPADRIIGATAMVHGARLVTADRAIRDSGEVDCVW